MGKEGVNMRKVKMFGLFILLVAAVLSLSACGCKHEEVTDAGVAATCLEGGLTEGSHCSECGEVLIEQEVISATGHTEATNAGKAATCTGTGLTDGTYCSVCDEILVEQETIPATGHTEVTKTGKAATCTETGLTDGTYCSACKKTLSEQKTISALGHSTTSGTCSRCSKEIGDWIIRYYVDEFNQPTDEPYVINKSHIQGTFSNSATTNSRLYVELLVDKGNVCIFLYEYGSSLVKNYSSRYNEFYNIVMRTSDGEKITIGGRIFAGGDRIVIYDEDVAAVVEALMYNESVSFYIEESERPICNYLFTVTCSNFTDAFMKLYTS